MAEYLIVIAVVSSVCVWQLSETARKDISAAD